MKKTFLLLLASLLLAGCGTMGYPQSRNQRINGYLAQHPETAPEKLALLKSGQVTIGMNMGDVLAAWGQPRYSTKYSDGSDQWVYGNPLYGASYLYFQDTVLKSWQLNQ